VAEIIAREEAKKLFHQLMAKMKSFQSNGTGASIHATRRASTDVVHASSESCEMLRHHKFAVPHNRSFSQNDGTQTEHTDVFYAMDSLMSAPGHALELLTNGLGVYYRDGLDKRGVAWVIPCREPSSEFVSTVVSPIYFTRFFLELNEVLELPFLLVSLDEIHVGTLPSYEETVGNRSSIGRVKPVSTALRRPDTSVSQPQGVPHHHHHLRGAPLRFLRAFFAPYFFQGWNQFCFKQMLRDRWWPLAVRRALRGLNTPTVEVNLNLSAPPAQIALLKLAAVNGYRSFSSTPAFERLLSSYRIKQLNTTLPLLQRMWHVNYAELLVTTWGSTFTTATGLMLPRSWLLSKPTGISELWNATVSPYAPPPRQRILVLVHPQYCHEAYKLFRVAKKNFCMPTQRRKSRMVLRSMSVNQGALTDFSDPLFCVKFVFLHSLNDVTSSDLTFRCSLARP
jgi:hypothetical protein